ncbi:MAG: hypothetical protein COB53_12950 [Elusimicrobia bacterium]|nr:MAG: hypothetical protein COB53_12950 [Elusimicrobiota bacterium]
MTGRDLIALLGDGTAGRLVKALGGNGRLGYVVRLDNNNGFSRSEVEFSLTGDERAHWNEFSSRLGKALGSPRGLEGAQAPSGLRLRLEGDLIAWVRPVSDGSPAPLGKTSLGDPQLDAIIKTVCERHPISGVTTEPGRIGFRFRQSVSWPLFAVLDFARAFQPKTGDWARRIGGLEVRSFGLGAGVMDVELV